MSSPSESRARSSSRSAQAGFSLVEMLVVLVILGVMAAIAGPALRDPSGRRELDRAAADIAALFREARAEALLSGTESFVAADLKSREISASWTERRLALPQQASVAVLTASEELIETGKPSLRFFADGGATGGAVRLRLKESEALISVDWLTGKVERSGAGR
jgi:general secretion pathway protein H